jgi:hypothetical protein
MISSPLQHNPSSRAVNAPTLASLPYGAIDFAPFPTYNFNDSGISSSRVIRDVPTATVRSSPSILTRHTTDFSVVLYSSGTYVTSTSSGHYRATGCAFLVHDFISKSSFISASKLPNDIAGNNSQVAAASALVSGLEFIASRSHKRALIICHDLNLFYFMVGTNSVSKGARVQRLKTDIRDTLLTFDHVYCSLITANHFLAESQFVCALSHYYATTDGAVPMPPRPASPNCVRILVPAPLIPLLSLELYAPLVDVPVLSVVDERVSECDLCGSPYHASPRCVLSGTGESLPRTSIFNKVILPVSITFVDSFANPALIDWSSAPIRLPNTVYVRFLATMLIVGIHDDHMLDAQLALIKLAEIYTYSPFNRQLILKRPHNDVLDADATDSTTASKIHAKAAMDIRQAALLIEQRQYAKANRYIYREEKINVDDPRIAPSVWSDLHPEGPARSPRLGVFRIPYDPCENQYYHIDRQCIADIISKWDVELAPGFSGFPASFLIHFCNLTVKHETAEKLNPFFTALVTYVERLASGMLPKIRYLFLQYKGALLNKMPPGGGFKIRNLCMPETFMKLASGSLLNHGIQKALACGALSDHDLGCGVPGGVERFVHAGQISAANGVAVLSLDIKGAYNNVLRSRTWDVLHRIGCPFLTQWFIYCFGECPRVHYIRDSKKSKEYNESICNPNLRTFPLCIGYGQGENLAGFYYSITQRSYIIEFLSRWTHTKILYNTILDDGALHVPPDDHHLLKLILKDLVATLTGGNLCLTMNKSELFCMTLTPTITQAAAACNIGLSCSDSLFVLCRVPIGRPEAIAKFIRVTYFPKIDRAHERFLHLHAVTQFLKFERFNTFYIFLRSCLVSKCSYWMRCLHPNDSADIMLHVDTILGSLLLLLYPPPLHHPETPLFQQLHGISRRIEELSLSKQGLGLVRGSSVLHIAFFASISEAYKYIVSVMSVVGLQVDPSVFDYLRPVVNAIQAQNPKGIAIDFYSLQEDQAVSHLQCKLSTGIQEADRVKILTDLPLTVLRQVFRGSYETYSCLPFNSAARDVTKKGAIRDPVFRFAFARRSLRPIFSQGLCKCGVMLDPTGSHILYCRESRLFQALHSALLDAIVGWMQAYIRKHSPSAFRIVTERGDDGDCHKCWVRRYYAITKGPRLGKRADAILFHESDQFRPFLLDVTTVMLSAVGEGARMLSDSSVISLEASELGPMLDKAYQEKMTNYSAFHAVPSAKIVPLVIGRSGMIHPLTLLFFDFFICNAHVPCLTQAPTGDRLSLLHTIMNALQDTVAISFKNKYDEDCSDAVMSLFPLEVAISSVNENAGGTPAHFA